MWWLDIARQTKFPPADPQDSEIQDVQLVILILGGLALVLTRGPLTGGGVGDKPHHSERSMNLGVCVRLASDSCVIPENPAINYPP